MVHPNPAATDPGCLAADAPPSQAARLAALRSYHILDTPVEGAFEDITRIAALVCQAPIAVVNLVDEHRQWFKSERGLGIRETPLDTSFCAHALLQNRFMEIPDTRLDPRFVRNPLVTGEPGLRFYAGALIRTAAGHALGTVCVLDTQPRHLNEEQRRVLRALSRQVMSQLELRRALFETSRAYRSRGRLMAIAGHDLKQPLTTITMVLDSISSEASGDQRRIQIAHEAADRLGRELDDLARASRFEEDNEQIELELIQLDELIAEIAASWSPVARRKGLSIQPRVIDVQVRTNRIMLRTILDNLLGNAIKYTTQGSVTLACRKESDGLWIDVIDTGIGIPESRRDEIFMAFSQLDPDAEGLGLGLSIVRSTAEMLGYQVKLAVGNSGGSMFSVQLPLASANPPTPGS